MEKEIGINFLNKLWGRKTDPHSDLIKLFRPQYDGIEGIVGHKILCIVVGVGPHPICYRDIEGFTIDPGQQTLSFGFKHQGHLLDATYSLEPQKTDIIFITAPQ